jgi:hypothetical protein
MEEESFSNEATAALMNRLFVSIKVDREERPDLDHVYMSYVTATTGSGGWPMTVFLTPDRKPFYGGTYFPPQDRYGMPGFPTLLQSLAEAWRDRRGEIEESAESAAQFLAARPAAAGEKAALGEAALRASYESHSASFDAEWGGFGSAPKFPRSHAVESLLRWWRRTGQLRALEMAGTTLVRMAEGGMADQLGGGFHRYSTDRQWRLPHFEKMLYDQALLASAYVEAYRATGQAGYARVARETLDYVLREMTDPEGGFRSAQDADSDDPHEPGKKREGAFYVWRLDEIRQALPADDAALFAFRYGVEERGNAPQDPHQEFEGQNVLYVAHSVEETARRFGKDAEAVAQSLERSRRTLLARRAGRPAPYLDDKVLTDWNGLMIAALAEAAGPLGEDRYRAAAVRAAEFVLTRLRAADGALLHRWRDGEAGIAATLDDYAFMLHAMLALYEATFDPRWLEEADGLARQLQGRFADTESGGFFLTPAGAADVIARPKPAYDGATPSGNSVAALALAKLGVLRADPALERAADRTLEAFSPEVASSPWAYPQMLEALDYRLGPTVEIVISGDREDSATQALLAEAEAAWIPNRLLMLREPGEAGRRLERAAALAKDKEPVGGRPAAYVCRGRACGLPVTEPGDLERLLADGRVQPPQTGKTIP